MSPIELPGMYDNATVGVSLLGWTLPILALFLTIVCCLVIATSRNIRETKAASVHFLPHLVFVSGLWWIIFGLTWAACPKPTDASSEYISDSAESAFNITVDTIGDSVPFTVDADVFALMPDNRKVFGTGTDNRDGANVIIFTERTYGDNPKLIIGAYSMGEESWMNGDADNVPDSRSGEYGRVLPWYDSPPAWWYISLGSVIVIALVFSFRSRSEIQESITTDATNKVVSYA